MRVSNYELEFRCFSVVINVCRGSIAVIRTTLDDCTVGPLIFQTIMLIPEVVTRDVSVFQVGGGG